ncbi:uncharacterized protein LOC120203609 isoform X1 [Hibiscus syriacus]|uniref:uncharacterized protein LOC120203609 isoform X1 n=1 Tax=Hibiscus syriacus TaxID=106335 RepID=UPI001924F5E7|nr:uncharacterized protein LOC120203609 isoform X1 [Hibiscus syriacus]
MAQPMAHTEEVATPQDQKHTKVNIRNNSKHELSLASRKVWEGDQDTPFPGKILDGDVSEFTHSAGLEELKEGSVAGLAYKILDDGETWVVTWSNPRGQDSKVYNDIVDGGIDWDQIKKELDNRGGPSHEVVRFGYRARIVVDSIKALSPTVTAYVEPWP